jgi:hypothetical protein
MGEESEPLGQSFGDRARRLDVVIPARRLETDDVESFRGPSSGSPNGYCGSALMRSTIPR